MKGIIQMRNFRKIVLLAPALALLGAASEAAAEPACRGLVLASNDYFLASMDGTILTRFTSDARAKEPASLAPDGSRIAYVVDYRAQTVAVANSAGVTKTFSLKPPAGTVASLRLLLDVKWKTANVLQTIRHGSPDTAVFDHYTIPDDLGSVQKITRASLVESPGTSCSLASVTLYPACVFGSDITVAGDYVYRKLPYAGTSPVETFTIPTGATVTSTAAEEAFQITLVAVNVGYYTLRVTFTGGAAEQAIVPAGDSMALQVDGDWYGLAPTYAAGGAKVAVYKSAIPNGDTVFDSAIAWRGQDGEVITIEKSATDKSLSVLERNGTSTPPVWKSIGKGVLPISERIDDLRFVSPNFALIQTDSEYALYPVTITKSPGGTATVVVGSKKSLPKTITITPLAGGSSVDAQVVDWACTGS